MPIFEITDPGSGLSFEVEGDSPPSEQELVQIFTEMAASQERQRLGAEDVQRVFQGESLPMDIAEGIIGGVETAATIGSGIVAEPLAGLAGIATAPFVGAQGAAQNIKGVKEALTFTPPTKPGQETLAALGEALKPVGEGIKATEDFLGEGALEATGSPALAAAAATLPTAAMEALGLGAGKLIAKAKTGLKGIPKIIPENIKIKAKEVTQSIIEAAPDISRIKEVSRSMFKELDDLGITAKPIATKILLRKIINVGNRSGADAVLTPKSARVVKLMQRELADETPRTLSDFDRLRKVAQKAAASPDPTDAAIGLKMVDEIDSFMDGLKPNAFKGVDAKKATEVGKRYKAARTLWGRARRAEVMGDIFKNAGLDADFAKGLSSQLKTLLKNKKRRRFFSKEELSAMEKVVKGGGKKDMLQLVGRLGFGSNSLQALGGIASTGFFGPLAPAIGTISKKIADNSTKAAADGVDALIRGGGSAREIATAYMKAVPAGKRSVDDLSDLFLASGAEVSDLLKSSNKAMKEAAEIVRGRRAFLTGQAAGAAVAPAAQTVANNQEQQ